MTDIISRRGLVAIPLLLSACSGKPPPPPAPGKVTVQLNGGVNQNPDPIGDARPVLVRIYQLLDTTVFTRADVFAHAHGGGGLALPRGCRRDGGYQDELAIGAVAQGLQKVQVNLGFVVPVGLQVLCGYPEALGGQLRNVLEGGLLGNFDVTQHCGGLFYPREKGVFLLM